MRKTNNMLQALFPNVGQRSCPKTRVRPGACHASSNSREAAEECSPRRKAWVKQCAVELAPSRRKKAATGTDTSCLINDGLTPYPLMFSPHLLPPQYFAPTLSHLNPATT